jgi:hypothetical protein
MFISMGLDMRVTAQVRSSITRLCKVVGSVVVAVYFWRHRQKPFLKKHKSKDFQLGRALHKLMAINLSETYLEKMCRVERKPK